MAGAEIPNVFGAVETSIVSDALDRHNLGGVITGLTPVHPHHRAVGRARPMQFERAESEGPTNFPYAMLEELAEGWVFVISNPDPTLSCWGGLASKLATAAGLNGVVIDGGYWDARAIREGSFPVFGRGATPRSSQGRMRVASIGGSIQVEGVEVGEGDIVVADYTGTVIVPEELVEAVAETVATIRTEEQEVDKAIEAGATIEDLKQDDRTV